MKRFAKRSESVKVDYEDHTAEFYTTTRQIKPKNNSITEKPTQNSKIQMKAAMSSLDLFKSKVTRFSDQHGAANTKDKTFFELISD